MNQKTEVLVFALAKSTENPEVCRFCVKPTKISYVIFRGFPEGISKTHYCCDRCAEGWAEIADDTNNMTV